MLRLLLCLSALHLYSDHFGLVFVNVVAEEHFDLPVTYNFSSYPFNYFGKVYTQVYVSVANNKMMMCFSGYYDPQIKDDCIEMPEPDNGTQVKFKTDSYVGVFQLKLSIDFPTITEQAKGYMLGTITHMSLSAHIILFSYETQGIVWFNYRNSSYADLVVDGEHFTRVATDVNNTAVLADVSGCRSSGYGIAVNGSTVIKDTCEVHHCGPDRNVTIETCGENEYCDGKGNCVVDVFCSLTGPTVIDIQGQVNSVEDRCSYSLVSFPDSQTEVQANYQERRRRDVSFLDSVTLVQNNVQIHLEQGGRVQVNGSLVNLNSSVQDFHGVGLSKTQSGVTARVELSPGLMTVFFDGSTAQLQMEELESAPVDGLCSNFSRFSSARISSTSCETQYTEPADPTIDCSMMTERCTILRETPFSSCHAAVDPDPYVTACNETLCKYPAVDGLRCQFLEAYARACSLLSNATLEGWRSSAQCSASQDFCQDANCSDHEFCGLVSGRPSCLCRAIFASSYRKSGALGDPTVCSGNSASVSLVGCLLEEKGIDYSVLHLNDQSCKGEMDEESHMVTFSFDQNNDCGAVIMTNNSQVLYKNTIRTQNSSDIITRQSQFQIEFSCIHTNPEIRTVGFRIKDSSVIQVVTSEAWNYTVMMNAYTGAGRTQAVDSNTDVLLDQKIWMELTTEGLDADLIAVVIDSCWATDQQTSDGSLRYDLIQNSCANRDDPTVQVERNGDGTSSYFSFNMFEFTGASSEVYLHCQLHLCVKQNNDCVPDCSGSGPALRKRRFARPVFGRGDGILVPEPPAFISMAWIN